MTATALRTPKRAMPRRWVLVDRPSAEIEPLHDHELIHTLLVNRGFRRRVDANVFLDHEVRALPDAGLLPDIEAAVERIERAVRDGETIAVFGDYDVDGITSVAMMSLALQDVVADPAKLLVRLPTRSEGYGLNKTALEEFGAAGVNLLITVDCASTDEKGVALARSLGMDVIIIDHHHMSSTGPDGAITISPSRPDGGHYREMSAAGLTLLVVSALQRIPAFAAFRERGGADQFLDLAALGLVADISPLTGHNRQIVREGIRQMRRNPRLGLKALCAVATIDLGTVNSTNIGYGIAPRLNAAGRMGDPRAALDLLIATDSSAAQTLAVELDHLNVQRRAETDQVMNEVLERLTNTPGLDSTPILIESSDRWGPGVLGLAAGKLVELLGRPVILLREDGDRVLGSCRSVPGFHIADALHRYAGLLERHGGHSQAAGVTLRREAVDLLREALVNDPVIQTLDLPFEPELRIEASLAQNDITLDLARQIMRLSPFGAENPEPVLLIPKVSLLRAEPLGQDGSHLRLVWRGPTGEIRAPFFGAAWRAKELTIGGRVDIACTLSVDRWQGVVRPDVKVMDFRPSQ